MLVEQAIFTSVPSNPSAGYRLASRSSGVSDVDACALAAWGPTEGALIDSGVDADSTNFFPLPSGAYCVSRTSLADSESTGRDVGRVYTQCLIVPPEVLAQFANNPFVVLRAAKGAAAIVVHESIPAALEPVRLSGGAPTVDVALLAQLSLNPGPLCIAVLVERALASQRLAMVGGPEPERLIAGLLNCLPVPCRCAFSFSTGLKFSPSRPFRVSRIDHDAAEYRRCARQVELSLLDVVQATVAAELSGFTGWAAFVAEALATGKTAYLAAQISRLEDVSSPDALNAQGQHLRRYMHEPGSNRLVSPSADSAISQTPARAANSLRPTDMSDNETTLGNDRASDAGKEPSTLSAMPAAASRARWQPAGQPVATETQDLLEQLDDLVFQAIAGDVKALEELTTRWPQVCSELPDDLVDHSREQYLRSALAIWTDYLNQDQRPERAVWALDVLCLLFQQ